MNTLVSQNESSSTLINIKPLRSTPRLFLHCALFLPNNRIISDETFRLETFEGKESVSALFEYELELHANSSEAQADVFSLNEILGCSITVGIEYPCVDDQFDEYTKEKLDQYSDEYRNESYDDNSHLYPSFKEVIKGAAKGPHLVVFNGIVTSFSIKNWGTYRITMKPALHRLSLTNHYKLYAHKNICDLIKTLLDAQQISYEPFNFSPKNLAVIRTQDWLQAGETDLEFLQRLLAKAHVYFYFKHTAKNHTLVFSNYAHYDPVFDSGEPLRYCFSNAESLGLTQCNVVSEYSYTQTLNSSGVSGVLTQQGEAWQDNQIVPYVSYQADDSISVGTLPFNLYKSYQYGGSIYEVKDIVDAVKSTIASASSVLTGSSNCAYFKIAHTFILRHGHSSGVISPYQSTLEREPFVLTMVSHSANADGTYKNQFQASTAKNLITPYSMQETQQVSLLAIVVAHAPTAVQDPTHFGALSSFDPENNQFLDGMNSQEEFQQQGVFVTFSTDPTGSTPVWVKISASMQTVPTIGAIVQVARAQDESELPEIQNIIQTNGSMQVIPAGWLANTHVGSSFSTNYGNSKSINYGAASNADLQQSTSVVNTAYDSGRFDSVGFTQGTNYSFSCADSLASGASHSDSELYGTLPVASDLLSATESFGSTYSRQHASITSNYSVTGFSYSNSSTNESMSISSVGTVTNISTVGNTTNKNISGDTLTTSTSGDTTETTTSGNTHRISTSGNLTESTTSGNTTRVSNSGNLTENTTTGDINQTVSNGDIDNTTTSGTTNNTNISEASTNTTITGISTTIAATGVSTHTAATGASTQMTATGVSTEMSAVGVATSINVSGMTTNISSNEIHNVIEFSGPGYRLSNKDEQPDVDNIVIRVTMVDAILVFM